MADDHATRRVILFLLVLLIVAFPIAAEKATDIADRLGLTAFESGVEAPDFELEFLDGERAGRLAFFAVQLYSSTFGLLGARRADKRCLRCKLFTNVSPNQD